MPPCARCGLRCISSTMNSRTMSKLARRRVRNGLMGALLAMYSIRLKNFSALEIWRNLVS